MFSIIDQNKNVFDVLSDVLFLVTVLKQPTFSMLFLGLAMSSCQGIFWTISIVHSGAVFTVLFFRNEINGYWSYAAKCLAQALENKPKLENLTNWKKVKRPGLHACVL